MKILYGIQGTGNGHISRSTEIIGRLTKGGGTVDVVLSGCDKDKVFDHSVFEPIRMFKGFSFACKNGAIQYFNTLRQISLLRFVKDVISFDASGYDLIITDFEPVTAMIARKNNIPAIGVGHQYAFVYDIPVSGNGIMADMVMSHFASATYPIGLHWNHFGHPILPPVIPGRLCRADGDVDPDLILVYLPFENPMLIWAVLRRFKDYRFAVYAGNRHVDSEALAEKHIQWHGFSKTRFFSDLKRCSGVICNAGFELPSEAIYLGKKLLVKPVKGQFEQASNAMTLELLRLGTATDRLTHQVVKRFLESAPLKQTAWADTAGLLSDWVLEGQWDHMEPLVRTAWA